MGAPSFLPLEMDYKLLDNGTKRVRPYLILPSAGVGHMRSYTILLARSVACDDGSAASNDEERHSAFRANFLHPGMAGTSL